jgi:hypothetical protein
MPTRSRVTPGDSPADEPVETPFDTTPNYPEPPPEMVEAAIRGLPDVLEDMRDQQYLWLEPVHGHRVVPLDRH